MSVKVHEAFCFDSFMDRLLFWDDFHGDQIQDEWAEAGVGSAAVVDAQTGGIVRLTTGAVTNNTYRIDWGAGVPIRSLLITKRVSMEVRVKLNQTTQISTQLALRFDGSNYVAFYNACAGAAANWFIYCTDGGATTSQNAGALADTSYHIFRIECHIHGGSHVHFYIDGTETANSPINTDVPDDAGDYLMPYLWVQTTEDVAKTTDIDYVYIRQDR